MSLQHTAKPSGHGWTRVVNLDVWHWRRDLDKKPAPGIRKHELDALDTFDAEHPVQVFDAGKPPPDEETWQPRRCDDPGPPPPPDFSEADAALGKAVYAHEPLLGSLEAFLVVMEGKAWERFNATKNTVENGGAGSAYEDCADHLRRILGKPTVDHGRRTLERHPDIGRFDSQIARFMEGIEAPMPKGLTTVERAHLSASLRDLGALVEHLTAARANLLKAGPS